MTEERKVFDFRGLQCPMPVFETAKAIKEVEVGSEILVLANDPAAKPDLEAWSKRTGHPIIKMDDKGSHIELLIKRAH